MWRIFKDDSEINCDTKTIIKNDIEKVRINIMKDYGRPILFRRSCEDTSKVILNLIVIQKRL